MKRYHLMDAVLLLLSVLLLTFCSGSSGGGTGGTGIISRGAITEFGSVVVNGTEFDTGKAVVMVGGKEVGRGDAGVRQHLDIGRVVTVAGSGSAEMENAVAEKVSYRSQVKGPVAAIFDMDAENRELLVLGQTVVLNPVTQLKGTGLGDLAVNDMVEVSGFYDDAGTIWATFVEKIGEFDPDLTVEVVGVVFNLKEALQQFEISDLQVDYAGADLQALPNGLPVEGMLVEVEGAFDTNAGNLQATRIGPADRLDAEDADQVEVMGFVTGVATIYEFIVGNQKVQVEPDAEVVDGTLVDIDLGVKLEAEGILAGGVLYADEIEFWLPDQSEVEGLVTEITAWGFYIGNQEIVTGAKTVYEDGSAGDVQIGMKIEVKGRLSGGIMQADKVSFERD